MPNKIKCVLGNSYINADTKKNAWKSPFNSIGPLVKFTWTWISTGWTMQSCLLVL